MVGLWSIRQRVHAAIGGTGLRGYSRDKAERNITSGRSRSPLTAHFSLGAHARERLDLKLRRSNPRWQDSSARSLTAHTWCIPSKAEMRQPETFEADGVTLDKLRAASLLGTKPQFRGRHNRDA
jgi:hypothetical protein